MGGGFAGRGTATERVLGVGWGIKRGRSRDGRGLGLQYADGGFGHGGSAGCLIFLGVVRGGGAGLREAGSRVYGYLWEDDVIYIYQYLEAISSIL